jgi:hypothetical protein
MLVSHSQLAVFRRCPREHYFRYGLGRYPLGTSAALATGRSIHAAIGAFLRGEKWELTDPMQRAMMLGYEARWRDAGWTIERTDVPFVFTIGEEGCPDCNFDTWRDCATCHGTGFIPIEMNGEIDAVGYETTRPEERAIFEHKTTSEDITPGSAYWRKVLMVDAQVSTYLRAGQMMGYQKVVYDVLRKPALRQKQKESPEAFCGRIVADIAERPEYYYQRAVVVRLENEREDFVKDVLGTVRLMMVGEYPRNVDSCFKWNRPCDFFSVCSGEVGIDDEARFQTRERKPKPEPEARFDSVSEEAAKHWPRGASTGYGGISPITGRESRVDVPPSQEGQDSPAPSDTVRSPQGGEKYIFGSDAEADRPRLR